MKTKQIPAVVMLTAGFIVCVFSIFQGLELGQFLKNLVGGLIIFYVIGVVIKVIVDKNFREMGEEQETEEQEAEEQSEDASDETEDDSGEDEK